MSRSRRHFVIRTITNGQVKIYGVWFKPDLDASKFNGMRAAFGLYYGPPSYRDGHAEYDAHGLNRSFVALWGSEKLHRAKTEEEIHALWPGPFCEDGIFKWEWWNRVDTSKSGLITQSEIDKVRAEPIHYNLGRKIGRRTFKVSYIID